MELVFYDEAARLLDVSFQTIKQAASRGDLTRAAARGNRGRLIKEQVLLFSGINPRTGNKKRISYNALSPQEQGLFDRYAREAERTPETPALETLIGEKVRDELARQEAARILADKKELEQREERFRKAYPKQRELLIAV